MYVLHRLKRLIFGVRTVQGQIRFLVRVMGNTMNSHEIFVEQLKFSSNLREVSAQNEFDVIIAFVPIVSRAGTDIEAALQVIPATKPLVLVVLHHTFDKYYVAPDSRFCVNRSGVFAVDCLYYEDQGLLRCLRNEEAVKAVKQHLSDMLPEESGRIYPYRYILIDYLLWIFFRPWSYIYSRIRRPSADL